MVFDIIITPWRELLFLTISICGPIALLIGLPIIGILCRK